MYLVSPFAHKRQVVRSIDASQTQARGISGTPLHVRIRKGSGNGLVHGLKGPLLAHCMPITWTGLSAAGDSPGERAVRGFRDRGQYRHGMTAATIDADQQRSIVGFSTRR